MPITFSIARELIEICHMSKLSLHLWGVHGIGKSALVRQFAEDRAIGFVDLRLAQLDATDLRGLPDRSPEGTTQFLPPEELPRNGSGILFLDELNRSSAEVRAAIFQLVLDRRIGNYILPEGWTIVAAGNFYGDEYDTHELDPAFRDRFLHAVLANGRSTFDEWSSYVGSQYSGAFRGISFCASNLDHLETACNAKLDFKVSPSRRSWEMVFRFEESFAKGRFSRESYMEGLAGLIGRDLAIAYSKYQISISPNDLLDEGVAGYADLIMELPRDQKWALAWGLVSHIKDQRACKRAADVAMDLLELLFRGCNRDSDLGIAFVCELLRASESTIGAKGIRMLLLRKPQLIMDISRANTNRNGTPNLLDALSNRPELLQEISNAIQVK